MRFPPPGLSLFNVLPPKERWFVRARWWSAPLEAVASQVPSGKVLEVGCGHGLFCAQLGYQRPDRQVLGIDPDARKIVWAKQALKPLDNVRIEENSIAQLLPQHAATFDAIVVSDVLYLLPLTAWAPFFESVHTLLKPKGKFFLKEAEAGRGWKSLKCVAQERVMVQLIGKTHGSGGLHLESREATTALLEKARLKVREVVDLSRGFTTPHVLYVASRDD